MSKLLINEPPLQVLPSLAKAIGLNEAMVLQQAHYWLGVSNNERDGKTWFYKTYEAWQAEFPFWSVHTLRRTIRNLETKRLLMGTDKYNTASTDRTKWYTIDYEALKTAEGDIRGVQIAQVEAAKLDTSRGGQIGHLYNTETTTEITLTEKKDSVPVAQSEKKPEAKSHGDGDGNKIVPPALEDSKWTRLVVEHSFHMPFEKARERPQITAMVHNILKQCKKSKVSFEELQARYEVHEDKMQEAERRGKDLSRMSSPGTIVRGIEEARVRMAEDNEMPMYLKGKRVA